MGSIKSTHGSVKIMKVILTGATGFLGNCILRLSCPWDIVPWSRSMRSIDGVDCRVVDLYDSNAVNAEIALEKPDWIINTAAITNVDFCEEKHLIARRANVEIVSSLASACRAHNVGLLHLSTDYVFDGESGPYEESQSPHPISHYGELKLESERIVLNDLKHGIVVRTMWLYGYTPNARANMITWPLNALLQGNGVNIVEDQWGNPTYGPDLACCLSELCRRNAYGLWHVGGGSFLTRHQQVREMAEFFSLDASLVNGIKTEELGQSASRPLISGLITSAVEKKLDWYPMSFKDSLNHLIRCSDFKNRYPQLVCGRG